MRQMHDLIANVSASAMSSFEVTVSGIVAGEYKN